jgi:hypothetical protein
MVAGFVLFLASDRAAAITGSEYLIDGGMVKTAQGLASDHPRMVIPIKERRPAFQGE